MCKIVKQHTFNLKTKTVLRRELVPHMPGFLPASLASIAVADFPRQQAQNPAISGRPPFPRPVLGIFSQTQLPISTGTFFTDPFASFLGPTHAILQTSQRVFLTRKKYFYLSSCLSLELNMCIFWYKICLCVSPHWLSQPLNLLTSLYSHLPSMMLESIALTVYSV